VRPRDRARADSLLEALRSFDEGARALPGINNPACRAAFIEQILESIHRAQIVGVLKRRRISFRRIDPNSELFDPLKAAILKQREGDIDEAFWLVFLFVHFGRHARAGWRYAREVYGRLGDQCYWDWQHVRGDPQGFRDWLHGHRDELEREGIAGGFGNHRKYETLDARSLNGTGAVVETYAQWVNPPRTHQQLVVEVCGDALADDPRKSFDELYHSMAVIQRFGRTARFDYLTMVGKLGLAMIEPGSAYLRGATGPLRGARLLFGEQEVRPLTVDSWLIELDAVLHVGMQVLEDALCNWQKNPQQFVRFRG
jgi:hypothetical protein